MTLLVKAVRNADDVESKKIKDEQGKKEKKKRDHTRKIKNKLEEAARDPAQGKISSFLTPKRNKE